MNRSVLLSLLPLLVLLPLCGCGSGVRGAVPLLTLKQSLPEDVPYQLISQLGCAHQDIDLNTGLRYDGSPGTDDTACINAALAVATAAHPVTLVQDGASLVSGIHGPSTGHWSIVGLGGAFSENTTLIGTGFYQKTGANDDVIYDGASKAGCPSGYSDPGAFTPGPAPARGSNIILRNFAINGNRGNGHNGNSTRGGDDPRGYTTTGPLGVGACWFMGIDIMDVDNVEVSGVSFYNTSAYNLRLSNVGHATVAKSTFANMGLHPSTYVSQNGDGTHIDGPANDISIANNLYATTDDAIALNAPEGWGGPITNVTVTNSTVTQAAAMIRIYTGSGIVPAGDAVPTIANVSIDNFNGKAKICGLFGLEVPRTLTRLDTISNVKWANSTCTSDFGSFLMDNVASLEFSDFIWGSSGTVTGFLNATEVQSHAGLLTFSNVTVSRSGNGKATALYDTTSAPFGVANSSSVDQITVNGFKVVNASEVSFAPMPNLVNINAPSTVGVLGLSNVDMTNIASLVSNPALVTTIKKAMVNGAGVDR